MAKLSAKERKAQATAKERAAKTKTSGRRASKVTTYVSQKAKVKRSDMPHKSYVHIMGKPKGLSAEARFDMLRPDCVSPFDWASFFTDDEDIWPEMVEEATDMAIDGDIEFYPKDGRANVSRRGLS